jgi:predicted dehydrogenase
MATRPTHIGIIGLGFMGATHIKAWQKVPGARVAALCNPSGRHLDGDFSSIAGNLGAAPRHGRCAGVSQL